MHPEFLKILLCDGVELLQLKLMLECLAPSGLVSCINPGGNGLLFLREVLSAFFTLEPASTLLKTLLSVFFHALGAGLQQSVVPAVEEEWRGCGC